jgi:hypothetical protein
MPFAALIFPALLAGCASSSEISDPRTGGFLGDSGAYEYYGCEQIAATRAGLKAREEELKQLIDKAEKGAGGAFVSAIAYKAEYQSILAQIQVADATARDKKCK